MVNQGMNDWWFCYNRSILQPSKNLKSYTPHKDQGKGWIKCQLISIVEEYFVIGIALVNCIGIVATPHQQPST